MICSFLCAHFWKIWVLTDQGHIFYNLQQHPKIYLLFALLETLLRFGSVAKLCYTAMILQDVVVYVAAKKAIAPILPLREALVTVAIECVYETQKKENCGDKRRKRVSIAEIMRRRRQTQKLQTCTLYSFDKEVDQNEMLSNYFEKYSGEAQCKKGGDKNTMTDTIGASTLSSLTMTNVIQSHDDLQRKKEASMDIDFMEIESFMPIDAPSLASSDVDDIDDMTMCTFALIGETKVPPKVSLSKDDAISKRRWWYEESARVGPLVFEDPKDKEDCGINQNQDDGGSAFTERFTAIDSILYKEIDANSRSTCDLSTMVDSTCALFCSDSSLFLPENYDLQLKVQTDEDISL